jgi:hypothetical protein
MNLRRTAIALFFLFFSLQTWAQSNRQVSGRVLDSTGLPLSGATVRLWSKAGKDTLKSITGSNGAFLFRTVPAASFTIAVSSVGYGSRQKDFSYPASEESIRVEDFSMAQQFTSLQEVIVSVPPIQVKEDTIEFKADSFRVKPDAMTEDLLKKLPGVTVDKNGNVTAQGKQVTRVKVNGKDFFGGDVKTATREIPAEMIDKVQVVDDYGDLANVSGIKDGEPEKVINLQLKKDRNKGVFGRATAGAGTQDRYQASFNANLFEDSKQLSFQGNTNNINNTNFNEGGSGGGMNVNAGGVGRAMTAVVSEGGGSGRGGNNFSGGSSLGGSDGVTSVHSLGTNYRQDFENSKGSSVYGSYSFTRRLTDVERSISQENFFDANTFTNEQDNKAFNTSNQHRAFLNFEYKIDSFNYLKISPSFTYGETDNENLSDFSFVRDKNVVTSEGQNRDSTRGRTPNLSLNAIYNHAFRRRGRNLSVNLNLGMNRNESESDKLNFTRNLNLPVPVEATLRQLILQENESQNYGIRVNYAEPILKDRFLDLIYAYNYSFTRNDRETFTRDANGDLVPSPNLSNAFENTFVNQRLGANIRTVKKKYNYSLGIAIQPVNLDGYSITKDSNYTPRKDVNIFPVARFVYNFTRTRNLSFNYQGSARQPGFSQLQPVLDISNPQYQTVGNPNLKPELYHNFSLFYNNFNFVKGNVFFVGGNFAFVQHKIVNNVIPLGNAGAQLTRPENEDGYYNATGFYTLSRPYSNRTHIFSLNGTLNYNHNVGLIDSSRNIGSNLVASQGFVYEFNHKDWFEWDAGVRYSLNSSRYTLTDDQDLDYGSWIFTSNSRLDIRGGWILRYDFEYVINNGLAEGVNGNIALLNASIEKKLFKKQNGFLRLSGFDLFNQNKNISRTVTANSITDTRVNRLTRYFMLSFTYRLNRFAGQPGQGAPGTPGMRRF